MSSTSIFSILLSIIIFLTPSNLFYKISIENSYVNGLLIDYLIPKIYLSDVFMIIFVVIFGIRAIKNITTQKELIIKSIRNTFCNTGSFWIKMPLVILLSTITLLITRQLFTSNPTASIYFLLKLTLITSFIATAIYNMKYPPVNRCSIGKKLLSPITIFLALTTTVIFQSIVGLYQFLTQSPVYGFLFLGETNIQHAFGIPNAVIFGVERVLPHGTTSHPNILGGIIAVFLLLSGNVLFEIIKKKSRGKKKFQHNKILIFLFILSLTLGLATLFLTQSISAWLAFLLGTILITISKKHPDILSSNNNKKQFFILSIIIAIAIASIPAIDHFARLNRLNPSLYRRFVLNNGAISMIIKNPIWGVGLNNFTVQLESYSSNTEIVRFIQPVHHVGLLWISETGLLGMLLIISGLYLVLKNSKDITNFYLWTIILLPIAILDHYLLSNQSGLLLVAVVIITSVSTQKSFYQSE